MKVLSPKLTICAALALVAIPVLAKNPPVPDTVANKVRHQLVMLPRLGVFDDLSFRVDGSAVTLFGEVTQPVLKSDAGNAVKHVEGVTQVNNQIEVLPLSPMDWQVRRQEYRAIFGYAPLQRYGMGVIPQIHIIVKNGNVTLMGAVANATDKQLAYMRANGVPGVFSVTNQLEIEK